LSALFAVKKKLNQRENEKRKKKNRKMISHGSKRDHQSNIKGSCGQQVKAPWVHLGAKRKIKKRK
jgi:hypothetical protein